MTVPTLTNVSCTRRSSGCPAGGGRSFAQVSPIFCVPGNERMLGYWDRVEDRLYKLRHCQDIDGCLPPAAALRAAESTSGSLWAGRLPASASRTCSRPRRGQLAAIPLPLPRRQGEGVRVDRTRLRRRAALGTGEARCRRAHQAAQRPPEEHPGADDGGAQERGQDRRGRDRDRRPDVRPPRSTAGLLRGADLDRTDRCES